MLPPGCWLRALTFLVTIGYQSGMRRLPFGSKDIAVPVTSSELAGDEADVDRQQITRVLGEVVAGRADAAEKLLPLVYQDLRRRASIELGRLSPGQTLQPTALVHDAWLKVVGGADPGWDGRGHFYAAASQAMRELLIDHLRRKQASKRGGGAAALPLDAALAVGSPDLGAEDTLAVNAALERLEVEHPRRAQVVVMRYFGGLSEDEVAEALGVTARTVERDWRFARAFLHAALAEPGASDPAAPGAPVSHAQADDAARPVKAVKGE